MPKRASKTLRFAVQAAAAAAAVAPAPAAAARYVGIWGDILSMFPASCERSLSGHPSVSVGEACQGTTSTFIAAVEYGK